jgi:cell division protein FtsQ
VLKIRQLVQVIALLLSSVLLVLAIVFAEAKQAGRTCQSITITMTGKAASQLVDERVLLNQLAAKTTMPIVGAPLQALETQKIENIVKTNDFVRTGIAYKNWKGDLRIEILPRRPVARIIYPCHQSQYVDEDGTLLPLSDQYTARVLLVETEQLRGVKKNLQEHAYGTALLVLLNYIGRDPFWRAQIVYMGIDEEGKIVMHTQIGQQRVEFGFPEATEEKLAKLKLFYKQIVPCKGWNTYKRVNVEFDNQIVCE